MSELRVEHLRKSFRTGSQSVSVLQDVSFRLRSGDAMAVLGPSGSGKTTLLYVIGTLDQPTAGRIWLDDEEPHRLGGAALATFRRRHIGFVFQDHFLLPHLTALENVVLPSLAAGAVTGEVLERGRDLLDRVGLTTRSHHLPGELSGGERQRVALARALIHRPGLILADEPTGNLDRHNATVVADLLVEMQREENAMLMLITHSLELAERFSVRKQLADGVLTDAPF